MDSENRLCLLLVGLTELRRRLAMAVHGSLAQRLVVHYHLGGLSREELPDYLTYRLRLAGCELPLFEPPANGALLQATHGTPRKINRVAHYALISAAIDKAKVVTIKHVQAAREEIAPLCGHAAMGFSSCPPPGRQSRHWWCMTDRTLGGRLAPLRDAGPGIAGRSVTPAVSL